MKSTQSYIADKKNHSTRWQSYEEVAAYLLDQFADRFGLERVEGKQKVLGHRSGTEWEIDAKGIREGGEGFLIVECRRYTTSRQSQERVGGLAYRIVDAGADGGIIISPLGLQEGATKIAVAENIMEVRLDADSTFTDFALEFLKTKILEASVSVNMKMGMSVSAEVVRACNSCGEKFVVEEDERYCPRCRRADI